MGNVGKRPPILVLGDAAKDEFFPAFVRRFRRASAHAVVAATTLRVLDREDGSEFEAAARAWSRLEADYSPACLGLIAATGTAIEAACGILADGWADETLPGAIAFLGYDPIVEKTAMELMGASRSGRAVPGVHVAEIETAWPSTMFLLLADDPALAECAGACRRLRSVGVTCRLEIVGSASAAVSVSARETAMAEMVGEIGSFFGSNLTPYFPKRI